MRAIFGLLSILTLLISCNNQRINGPENMQKKNIELTHLYFEYFNSHQWEKMADMYAVNAEFKDPSLGPGIVKQTKKQVVEKYSGLNSVFPDIRDTIINTYPSGDNVVVVEFVSQGKDKDGNAFELPVCTIFVFDNGRISKDFTYYDNFDETK
jgi:ketosteroid isomerase-like protein